VPRGAREAWLALAAQMDRMESSEQAHARAAERASGALDPNERVLAPDTWVGGRYRVVALLGVGGMGCVHLAEDTREKRYVLKTLREKCLAEPEIVRLFWNEASALMRVRHENVVGIRDIVVDGRAPVVVMELVGGRTLESVIGECGALAPPLALWLLGQVSSALMAVHDAGIVHRDLKPANVMLRRGESGDPEIKIIDFGVARIERKPDGSASTVVAGTPGYMAPEQFAGYNVDHRSDVFAFGRLAYSLLAGTSYREGVLLPPGVSRTLDSEQFLAWFDSACHPDKRSRFGSAEIAMAELADALGVEWPTSPEPTSGIASVRPSRGPRRLWPKLAAVAAALALGAVVGPWLGRWTTDRGKEPERPKVGEGQRAPTGVPSSPTNVVVDPPRVNVAPSRVATGSDSAVSKALTTASRPLRAPRPGEGDRVAKLPAPEAPSSPGASQSAASPAAPPDIVSVPDDAPASQSAPSTPDVATAALPAVATTTRTSMAAPAGRAVAPRTKTSPSDSY
jgi:serine/threonine protein kinase